MSYTHITLAKRDIIGRAHENLNTFSYQLANHCLVLGCIGTGLPHKVIGALTDVVAPKALIAHPLSNQDICGVHTHETAASVSCAHITTSRAELAHQRRSRQNPETTPL